MELAVIQNPSEKGIPTDHEMIVFHTMAENAVSSKMYKGIGEKAAVMMIMLSARELGIPAMQALNGGLNIINGKVEISARMMSALIRKAGHGLKIKQSTSTICILEGTRGDTKETETVEFTFSEAQQAGLVKPGGGWVKWPKDMCFARALSRLARQLFSDVIGIGYVEGEISQITRSPQEIDKLEFEEDIPSEEPKEDLSEVQESFEKYLWIFDQEDRDLASEYLNIVKKHFGWSFIQTCQELMKDEKALIEKFNKWKAKK